jgi:hypothetical protein
MIAHTFSFVISFLLLAFDTTIALPFSLSGVQSSIPSIRYSFTYCSNGVDCDTEEFTLQKQEAIHKKQEGLCPAVEFTHQVRRQRNYINDQVKLLHLLCTHVY